jgi:hypothetical protein
LAVYQRGREILGAPPNHRQMLAARAGNRGGAPRHFFGDGVLLDD